MAQFLNDSMDENNMKVQFVETSIEYFASHDVRHARRKTGVIDTENFIVTPSSVLPVIKLSESLYSGYFDSHRHLFVGQDIGFGIKVTVPKSNQQVDISYKKYALENKKDSTESTEFDDPQQRMKKYGF